MIRVTGTNLVGTLVCGIGPDVLICLVGPPFHGAHHQVPATSVEVDPDTDDEEINRVDQETIDAARNRTRLTSEGTRMSTDNLQPVTVHDVVGKAVTAAKGRGDTIALTLGGLLSDDVVADLTDQDAATLARLLIDSVIGPVSTDMSTINGTLQLTSGAEGVDLFFADDISGRDNTVTLPQKAALTLVSALVVHVANFYA